MVQILIKTRHLSILVFLCGLKAVHVFTKILAPIVHCLEILRGIFFVYPGGFVLLDGTAASIIVPVLIATILIATTPFV